MKKKSLPMAMKRNFIALLIFGITLWILPAQSQEVQKEQMKREAEKKLEQMSPQQIEAKIKELGMTRKEAETRAQELGIDLNTYLQRQAAPTGPITPGQAKQLQPETKPDLPTAEEIPKEVLAEPEAKNVEEIKGEATTVGLGGLPYFGYDVFATTPAAFEPTAVGPADPEYLIGPEDILRVTVWGQVEFQNELAVDREGRIFIPTIGQVLVSGLTLEKAYQKLLKQMSRSYSGLVSQPPTVWLDVSIARLRPKRIFIMGEVRNPGGYTVHSYATVFSSLFSVGGPTVKGSLRDVRVIRAGKTIARVDLYDYLTGADSTNDIRVQTNDIIYVPVRGKTVSLKGEVRRPAIYELLPNENMRSLLNFAGGVKPTAYLERVQVDRIIPFEQRERGHMERRIIDVDFRNVLRDGKDYQLFDGDAISIYSVLDTRLNLVTIQGAVTRPGTYQLEKVPTLRDLIFEADSLLPEAYLGRADIFRTRLDLTYEAIRVDLAKALEGDLHENVLLEPLDQVRIYSIHEISERRFVEIRGHVKNPGKFVYADSLTLFDLVFKAGGLSDSLYRARTFLERADLMRLNSDGITRRTIPFNLGALLDGDTTVNRLLLPEDEVVIYELEVVELTEKYVEVFGKVRRPGRFKLTSNMTLVDAILLAGGYTEDAWTLQAEIARLIPVGMGEDTLAYIRFSTLPNFADTTVREDLLREEARAREFPLQHRDQIFVRENPEWKVQRLITVNGEVRFPGQYALKKRNERLSDVITRAGGPTKLAYLGGGQIVRQGQNVVVDFDMAITRRNKDHDIILHPGDVITIPPKPNMVVVTGEVNNPGILSFIYGHDVSDYIDRAGGLTDSAHYALLIKPTGETQKVNFGWFRADPEVPDGSVIRVLRVPPPPPEGEKVDIAATIKDVFAIMSSAATLVFIVWQVTK